MTGLTVADDDLEGIAWSYFVHSHVGVFWGVFHYESLLRLNVG